MDSESSRERVLCRFVVEHFSDPMIVLDERSHVVELNEAAWGPCLVDLGALFDPALDESGEIQTLLRLARSEGRAAIDVARDVDGARKHYRLLGTAIDRWVVVIVRDVTTEHAREEEARRLRRLETLGMLTASLVHDVNNLLTPILILSSQIARHADAGEAQSLAGHVESAADRAAALVRDALALVRSRDRLAPVDVGRVIEELRPWIERVLGDRVELEVAIEPTLSRAAIERSRLEHAILNLVANARDATQGRGRVSISVVQQAVEREPARREVVITIADTGAGMSEDVLARVRDPFFTTKEHGHGIGLASVQLFAAEHGGSLSIASTPGEGTRVAIRLPLESAPEVSGPAPRLVPEGARDGERVLVVDRSDEVRLAVRVALESAGYQVIEADGRERALEAAPGVDAVVLDATIAELDRDAWDALADAGGALVLMTGARVSEVPALPVLHKAFTEHELLAAVRDAIDRRGAASAA